jgi:hypothetical protein
MSKSFIAVALKNLPLLMILITGSEKFKSEWRFRTVTQMQFRACYSQILNGIKIPKNILRRFVRRNRTNGKVRDKSRRSGVRIATGIAT